MTSWALSVSGSRAAETPTQIAQQDLPDNLQARPADGATVGGGANPLPVADKPPQPAEKPSVEKQPPGQRPNEKTSATGPTTRPTTTPDPRSMSSQEMLGQMLRPAVPQPKPLQPIESVETTDKTSGPGAVKPEAPPVATLREGTYIIDRIGRLQKSSDGTQAQFVFDSDGKSLKEPPLIIVPNLKLMMMENAVTGASRDLKFRVSGMITEYRGRNHLILEKVMVDQDARPQF